MIGVESRYVVPPFSRKVSETRTGQDENIRILAICFARQYQARCSGKAASKAVATCGTRASPSLQVGMPMGSAIRPVSVF